MEPVLTMTGILTADGSLQIKVAGPASGNKVMMLGVLDLMRQALHAPPQAGPAPSPLLVARGALPTHGHA